MSAPARRLTEQKGRQRAGKQLRKENTFHQNVWYRRQLPLWCLFGGASRLFKLFLSGKLSNADTGGLALFYKSILIVIQLNLLCSFIHSFIKMFPPLVFLPHMGHSRQLAEWTRWKIKNNIKNAHDKNDKNNKTDPWFTTIKITVKRCHNKLKVLLNKNVLRSHQKVSKEGIVDAIAKEPPPRRLYL